MAGLLASTTCLLAQDAKSGGKLLWDFQTGRGISAKPISFALEGKQ